MSLPGLVAANNLSDVADKEKTWDNLGNGISYTINGNTSTGVVVKGTDILALDGVNELDVRDFVNLSNLASAAQPRLTTITTNTATAVALRDGALLKASPTSTGSYGITGVATFTNLQINGVGVRSLSTSPFSGGTATAAIYLEGISITSNFKINTTPVTGTLTTPTVAIPIELDGQLYYLRAGQS